MEDRSHSSLQTRYLVLWTPLADVERFTRSKGRVEGDGSSLWDWIDPEECTRQIEFRAFQKAASLALEVAPTDAFGTGRIFRQTGVEEDDRIIWEDDALWEVDAAHTPDEATPDQLLREDA